MLIEFRSVVDAVECAIAVQCGMAGREEDLAGYRRILFRIGINFSDVIVQNDDIFGDGVNVAARLQEVATPGGLALSEAANRYVEGR